MKSVKVVCPECGRSWTRNTPTENLEKNYIYDSTSDLCPDCSLSAAFTKNPNGVAREVRDRQRKEGNPQCFATSRRWKCSEVNCRWRVVCNGDMVESVAQTRRRICQNQMMFVEGQLKAMVMVEGFVLNLSVKLLIFPVWLVKNV